MLAKAIILGSARGVRRLDATKSHPTILQADRLGRRVVDWLLSAFHACGVHDVMFVGGYHIEKVMSLYPHLRYYYHPGWQEEGDARALACAAEELHGFDGTVLLARADVVFRSEVVRRLLDEKADLVIGAVPRRHGDLILPPKPDDYSPEPVPSAQRLDESVFARLAVARGPALEALRHHATSRRYSAGDGLLSALDEVRQLGISTEVVELSDNVAYVDGPRALAHFAFGSKAQTLERLRPLLRSASIPSQVRFTVDQWRRDPTTCLDRILATGGATRLIVRSSAVVEDGWTASAAGRFRSVLGVSSSSAPEIREAIEQVIQGFDDAGAFATHNEVFVQPQVEDVLLSGVLFTRETAHGAPYFVFNLDRASGRTDTVTSGAGVEVETTVLYRGGALPALEPPLARVAEAAEELEELLGHDALDIEFAVGRDARPHILQVRPLTMVGREAVADQDVAEELAIVRRCVAGLMERRPHLAGASTVFGTMPDWNPAEMIGTCPRPLALSLYQRLITDEVWAEARALIGYRDTRPEPLLVAFAGRPYIDVRVSLNSLLPAGLPDAVAERVVDRGLETLCRKPALHDKIEFHVAITCLAFDFDRRVDDLGGLSLDDRQVLRRSLLALSDGVLRGTREAIARQYERLAELARRRAAILALPQRDPEHFARKIRHLLHDTARLGTVPFAILARYAFIATAFLRSLVESGAMEEEQRAAFLRAVPSVATELSREVRRVAAGQLSRDEFLTRYGHLRPGTYDILSPSYREAPDVYLGGAESAASADAADGPLECARAVLEPSMLRIRQLLEAEGFQATAEELRDFIIEAIPARELSKFEFSKNLSSALSLLGTLGDHLGLTREEISLLSVDRLLQLATDSPSAAFVKELRQSAALARKRYAITRAIQLPDLMTSPADVDLFTARPWQPNFVGGQRVVAPVVEIDRREGASPLAGKIALIVSADPGYDWIFGHQIAGLVTKYGGIASHMAIRAAEFGLPAAIGCGEILYRRAAGARLLEVDCMARQIRVL